MTTDKLPDVVWLCGDTPRWPRTWNTSPPQNNESGIPDIAFVRKSALDAMTAERDALKRKVTTTTWEWANALHERDSAREALRAIRDSTYRNAVTLRGMADNFLAAQPETPHD